jgi:phosphatidylglycerophosphate synthase
VASTLSNENQFVVDLLTTLRGEKFSPRAWMRFLGRSWEMSWRTAHDNPTLKRSWMRVSLFISLLAIALLVTCTVFEGPLVVLHVLPGLLFCVVWQQSDLFWHLGLNRQWQLGETGKLFPVIGAANICTQLRGLGASFLLCRLIGRVTTPTEVALLIYLGGIITDILDGQIARRTHTWSKLGQITDSEADFCLNLAITVILMQHGILPLWLGIVLLLRFLIPLFAVLTSYFLLAHPVRFGSTIWGKYAGLAQSLYFFVLLVPTRLAFLTNWLNPPLLLATLALLVAAPVAQIVVNLRVLHA